MSDASNGALELDSVRAAFPGWHIGSSCGSRYAFRGGTVALDGPRSLLRCYLRADTLTALAGQFNLQDYLDSLSDQELAEVWHQVSLPEPPGQAAS